MPRRVRGSAYDGQTDVGDGHAGESQAKAAVAAASGNVITRREAEDLIGKRQSAASGKSARPRGVSKISRHDAYRTFGRAYGCSNSAAAFFGSRVVLDVPIENVFDYVNETALFKGQWQFKQGRTSAEEYRRW